MKRHWLRRGLRFLAFTLLVAGLLGVVVMSLWNALLPDIVGVKPITFGQALGLLALSRLFFGGFRGPWGPGGYGNREVWKQKMADRFQNLTPEQREAMRRQWRHKCGNRGRREGRGPGEPEAGPSTEM